jgi:predicted transcriptional regulator
LISVFQWGKKQEVAAIALANGETQQEAAEKAGVTDRTIRNWLAVPEFSEEVDRLTFLTGIAHKAERLRLAKRVIAGLDAKTERDLLDWLKYAQGETDGIKLELTGLLAAITQNGGEMADSGSV